MLVQFRRLAIGLIAGLALLGTGLYGPVKADVPESKEPVKIAMINYSGDNILSYVYGKLIQKLGYNIEYVVADYTGQFTGLAEGDLTIGSMGWDTTGKQLMADAWASGDVLNMGNFGVAVTEDWWYPLFAKEKCPGLPDWHALLEPECAASFATADTAPKGKFLSGPVSWSGTDAERIEALGLDFEVIYAGSDASLMSDFVASIKREQPVVGWAWEPYWMPSIYPGEFVVWPEYEDACYTDPSWGPNPDMTHDCGRPMGSMWKLAWSGGEEIWPKAYDVYRKYVLDVQTAGEMVYRSDIDGIPTEQVAQEWIDANEAIWSEWLK